MEENQNPTSPIAGEPASVNDLVLAVSQQYHALMGLRATLHQALWDFAQVADGWCAAAHDLADSVKAAHAQVTALLGITEPADEDTMFKRPLVESDFTVTGNSEGDEDPYDGKNPEWVKVEKACLPTIPCLDDEDHYCEATEGEIRAEAEAERQADAAYELAAELASCDWEGWY